MIEKILEVLKASLFFLFLRNPVCKILNWIENWKPLSLLTVFEKQATLYRFLNVWPWTKSGLRCTANLIRKSGRRRVMDQTIKKMKPDRLTKTLCGPFFLVYCTCQHLVNKHLQFTQLSGFWYPIIRREKKENIIRSGATIDRRRWERGITSFSESAHHYNHHLCRY